MKKSYYLVIALFVAVAVFVGGVLVYMNKGVSVPSDTVQENIQTGEAPTIPPVDDKGKSPEFKTTYKGRDITANPDYQIGILDGKLAKDPDVVNKTISMDVDIMKIFPNMDIEQLNTIISVSGAKFFVKVGNAEPTEASLSDLKEGDVVNVGLVDGQTNRDIVKEGSKLTAQQVYKFIIQ
ncbi:MAG: hypothetical protein PHG66_03120 [Candidatus Colwellbacteria bacterium]|nr:hypothetical protein [Candidatus Colwellbacteria bacterium]